ncbi:hypothetical protein CRUP_035918 [Coryphaenoides rupestris]|nr:hypothetical protein CRUP_035918 [Coryphaenoides rupestris]
MAASSKTTVVLLRAVKQVVVQIHFLAMVGSEKARNTNMNCVVTTIVKHDQSEPVVDITFVDGDRLVMKGSKLTGKEMLEAFQARCISKDPQGKANK